MTHRRKLRLGSALVALAAVLTLRPVIPAQATRTNNQGVHYLEINDGGTDVTALQYLLSAHGFATTADGIFGSGTRQATRWKTCRRPRA